MVLLASASPRRLQLLADAGYHCQVQAVDVDERQWPGETAEQYVTRVARLKATTARERFPGRTIIAADTAVVVDGEVFGKPVDGADAVRMLERLSGRAHDVLTGVAVSGATLVTCIERTVVWVNALAPEEIAAYVATGEPMDKAGAYAIQGRASRFIPRIEGSYSNVVGLPIATVEAALRRAGASDGGQSSQDGSGVSY